MGSTPAPDAASTKNTQFTTDIMADLVRGKSTSAKHLQLTEFSSLPTQQMPTAQ